MRLCNTGNRQGKTQQTPRVIHFVTYLSLEDGVDILVESQCVEFGLEIKQVSNFYSL